MAACDDTERLPAFFEAVLYPNRPISATGLCVVLGAVTCVTLGVGIGFLLAGAWPVTGFMGLELIALAIAFQVARHRAGYAEHVRLDADGLHVRAARQGRTPDYWRFEPYWVRVDVDEQPGGQRLLRLRSHGRSLTIGRHLTVEERIDFAAALKKALDTYRR